MLVAILMDPTQCYDACKVTTGSRVCRKPQTHGRGRGRSLLAWRAVSDSWLAECRLRLTRIAEPVQKTRLLLVARPACYTVIAHRLSNLV